MRKLLLLLLILATVGFSQFTDFYCDFSTGSNLYAGAPKTGGIYPLTYASGTWVQATGVFTPASGNPQTDGVTVGDFASVYADGASAPTGFVGRITARDTTTITVSLTAKSGSAPGNGTKNTTLVVGGTWKGPNANSSFPLNFIGTAMNDGTNTPRVNLKNTADYVVTARVDIDKAGPTRFQGYTTTPGDGGRFTIDNGTTAATILLVTVNSIEVWDGIFKTSAAAGNAGGVQVQGGNMSVLGRVAVSGAWGPGIYTAHPAILIECEAYNNNRSNGTSNNAGIFANNTHVTCIRCISHDNPGTNSAGFGCDGNGHNHFLDCVADSNGGDGFRLLSAYPASLSGCDAYNNGSDGIDVANAAVNFYHIENCNLVKNTGWGINGSGAGTRHGAILNCGFGAGTQVNGSGDTTGLSAMAIAGSITYGANLTPWVDPANGDFRINLAAAKGTGRGAFTQTAASYAGTVAYPDVGAAQHQDSGGGTRRYSIISKWMGRPKVDDGHPIAEFGGGVVLLFIIALAGCALPRKKH